MTCVPDTCTNVSTCQARKAPAAAAAAANAAAAGGTEDDTDDGTLGESLSAEIAGLKSNLAALAAQVAALQRRIDASSGSNASAGASASVAVHPFENCASLRDLLDMKAGVNPASIQNADDRRHWELNPHASVKATDPAKRAEEIRAFLVLVHGWSKNRGDMLPFNILRHLDGVASALRAVAKIAPALDVSTPGGAVEALLRMLSSSDIDARIAMRAVPKPERMQGLDVGPLLVSLSMYMEELSIAFSAASETSQKAPGIKIEAFGLFLGCLPPPLRSFVQQALNFTMNGSGMSHLSVSSLYRQVETTLRDDSLTPAALASSARGPRRARSIFRAGPTTATTSTQHRLQPRTGTCAAARPLRQPRDRRRPTANCTGASRRVSPPQRTRPPAGPRCRRRRSSVCM